LVLMLARLALQLAQVWRLRLAQVWRLQLAQVWRLRLVRSSALRRSAGCRRPPVASLAAAFQSKIFA